MEHSHFPSNHRQPVFRFTLGGEKKQYGNALCNSFFLWTETIKSTLCWKCFPSKTKPREKSSVSSLAKRSVWSAGADTWGVLKSRPLETKHVNSKTRPRTAREMLLFHPGQVLGSLPFNDWLDFLSGVVCSGAEQCWVLPGCPGIPLRYSNAGIRCKYELSHLPNKYRCLLARTQLWWMEIRVQVFAWEPRRRQSATFSTYKYFL